MERAKGSRGFTLMELLIVVVIIGILALIAIPRLASTKGKAHDAAARTDLRNAMTAQEAYYADYGSYAASESDLNNYFEHSSGVAIAVLIGNPSMYVMTAKYKKGFADYWCVNSTLGEVVRGESC